MFSVEAKPSIMPFLSLFARDRLLRSFPVDRWEEFDCIESRAVERSAGFNSEDLDAGSSAAGSA